MNLPLVSIVIPMYNQRPDFLRHCLEGAFAQTYPNIEIIVSDNHSNNESPKLLAELNQPNLKIVKPQTHIGIIDNFVFAASAATGEYIAFLSSDDVLYPQCIEKVVKPLLQDPLLAYSYCENAIIDEKNELKFLIRKNKLPTGTYSKKEIANRMYNNSEYWIIGGVIRHEYYKKVGFAKDLIASDWVMGFQLLKYGNVAYINETLSAIRFHERQGEASVEYESRHIIHHRQRIEKHNYIINDEALLREISLTKKKALNYRYSEILVTVVDLTRKYHKKLVSEKYVNEVIDLYKQTENGFNFNFLAKHYPYKYALLYTYILGFMRRTLKKLSKN